MKKFKECLDYKAIYQHLLEQYLNKRVYGTTAKGAADTLSTTQGQLLVVNLRALTSEWQKERHC